MKFLFKKICIASDHGGYNLKEYIKDFLIKKNVSIIDLGPRENKTVDYPDYAKKLSKDESIIDWNEDAETIISKVKAFAGWPGVQAELFDVKFKIHKAIYFNDITQYSPGSVIKFDHDKFEIKAKKGSIQITKLQLPGKNIITCKDLYNSNSDFSTKIKSYSVK